MEELKGGGAGGGGDGAAGCCGGCRGVGGGAGGGNIITKRDSGISMTGLSTQGCYCASVRELSIQTGK